MNVLVTGADRFTGGHLAATLARRGLSRCGRWCGRESLERFRRARRWPAAGVDADRRRSRPIAQSRGACGRGVDGRLPHRRDLPRSRAAGLGVSRRSTSTARATCSKRRRAAGRAPRRALQHRRRARPHRASAGERGRAVQSRRHLSGDQARSRDSWRASSAARDALEVVVARPIGIYGPGDTRFLKMFRGHRARPVSDARVGRGVLSPHLHRRSGRGLPAVRRSAGRRRAAPTSWPARATRRSTSWSRSIAAELRRRSRRGCTCRCGRSGLAGLLCEIGLRAAAASSRRSIGGGSTSTPRAARSTPRARAPSSASRRGRSGGGHPPHGGVVSGAGTAVTHEVSSVGVRKG